MHPVLFEYGFIKIFTYGVILAFGFLIAIFFASRQGMKEGIPPERIVDLCFYILVSSLIGARLLYIIVEYKYFINFPIEIFKFWKGGLVYYGGMILGTIVAIVYMRRHDLPVWKVTDLLAPSIALGQAIGRWGCFFAGCCYGVKTDVPWAITFSDKGSLAPLNIPLHPTQIYLSLNALIIFFVLMWFLKRKSFDGQILWTYGILYSIGRFIIEFFRGDDRGFVVERFLSTSQFISIFVLAVSVFMIVSLRRKNEGTAVQ